MMNEKNCRSYIEKLLFSVEEDEKPRFFMWSIAVKLGWTQQSTSKRQGTFFQSIKSPTQHHRGLTTVSHRVKPKLQ